MVSLLPAELRIVATDLNQPMLDYAAAKPSLRGRVTWQQADALALPFEAAIFDVVTCQFGAMFFPDKVKGYSEARRVLRPRGRFLFNIWSRISDNHFAEAVTEALTALFPQDPPLFMARTPHGYHDMGAHPRKPLRRGLSGYLDRDGRFHQQGQVRPGRCYRLLPGHAAAQRDRCARRLTP